MSILNNRRKVALVLFLLLAVAGACWLISSHRAPMVVVGTVSAKDVAEITRAVHRQMWHDTFSRLSWKTLKEFPGKVLRNATCHISGIYGDGESAVVLVANSKSRPPTMFQAQKQPKGWVSYGGY